MSKIRPPRQPWHLKASDFRQPDLYAKQDWRYQMFFEYLRISPSYALALSCSSAEELGQKLGDSQRAGRVWKVKEDMGNVFRYLYRDWFIERGLALFGVHSQKPTVSAISRLSPNATDHEIAEEGARNVDVYVQTRYQKQGRPDSVLVSVPLGQTRTATVRQLKKLLATIEKESPPAIPPTRYPMIVNKMRFNRLLAGLRLTYFRAARPNRGGLWRAAARAKISPKYSSIGPNDPKKDLENAEGRRMMSILASRLFHDTMLIAENAATGKFPSTDPIAVMPFELVDLRARLDAANQWEKEKKAELTLAKEQT